jgi:hypothetical protein
MRKPPFFWSRPVPPRRVSCEFLGYLGIGRIVLSLFCPALSGANSGANLPPGNAATLLAVSCQRDGS